MKTPLKLFFLGSVLVSLLFFSGCTLPFLPKPNNNNEAITLKYWGLWEPGTNFQALIDEYKVAHPNITVVYEERSPKFYYETLKSRLIGGNGPDIFRMHMSWTPRLAQLGMSPLPASIMDSNTYKSTFYPAAYDWCTVSGKQYCMPLMYDGLALVYNAGLFEAAGIDRAPRTWEEFRTDAKKLTITNNGTITQAGAAMGDEFVMNYSDIIGLLMLQNGASFQDTKGEVTFHNTISQDGRNTGAEALDFYTMFVKGGDKVWDKSLGDSVKAFAAGKVGMMFANSWQLQNVINTNPSLKVAVAGVPQLPTADGGTTNINWASFWVEGVSAKSAHPAEAWDFLKFITQREQQLNFQRTITASSSARTYGEIYSRADLASALSGDQYLKSYVEAAPTAKSWYFCDRTWDEKFDDTINEALKGAVKTAAGGGDSVSALSGAATTVQGVLTAKEPALTQ